TNMSVWTSVSALADYVYRSGHVQFLRRKREWFARYGTAHMVLWWVPAGHQPTVAEAVERLALLDANGSSAEAFTFAKPFPAPTSADAGAGAGAADASMAADDRNTCPA
ncbi:MAG: hypothetical protein JWL72_3335, partial [Ilumatobacteraceae bacterium]|nr:hypothetical protein [Ilumatobacteraceae bacterium]